ncbi:hypothetical protein CUU64_12465 [Bacillus sp. V5-8f]|nr:hypothetical protein CUU64_12465 [Bacillus sp. V5-8f]
MTKFNVLHFFFRTETTLRSVPGLVDYKGVRYAPVDIIGGLLQSKAIYYKDKDTVYFGKGPNGSYLSDLIKPYLSFHPVTTNESMTLTGQKYNKGYEMYFETGLHST